MPEITDPSHENDGLDVELAGLNQMWRVKHEERRILRAQRRCEHVLGRELSGLTKVSIVVDGEAEIAHRCGRAR